MVESGFVLVCHVCRRDGGLSPIDVFIYRRLPRCVHVPRTFRFPTFSHVVCSDSEMMRLSNHPNSHHITHPKVNREEICTCSVKGFVTTRQKK